MLTTGYFKQETERQEARDTWLIHEIGPMETKIYQDDTEDQ